MTETIPQTESTASELFGDASNLFGDSDDCASFFDNLGHTIKEHREEFFDTKNEIRLQSGNTESLQSSSLTTATSDIPFFQDDQIDFSSSFQLNAHESFSDYSSANLPISSQTVAKITDFGTNDAYMQNPTGFPPEAADAGSHQYPYNDMTNTNSYSHGMTSSRHEYNPASAFQPSHHTQAQEPYWSAPSTTDQTQIFTQKSASLYQETKFAYDAPAGVDFTPKKSLVARIPTFGNPPPQSQSTLMSASQVPLVASKTSEKGFAYDMPEGIDFSKISKKKYHKQPVNFFQNSNSVDNAAPKLQSPPQSRSYSHQSQGYNESVAYITQIPLETSTDHKAVSQAYNALSINTGTYNNVVSDTSVFNNYGNNDYSAEFLDSTAFMGTAGNISSNSYVDGISPSNAPEDSTVYSLPPQYMNEIPGELEKSNLMDEFGPQSSLNLAPVFSQQESSSPALAVAQTEEYSSTKLVDNFMKHESYTDGAYKPNLFDSSNKSIQIYSYNAPPKATPKSGNLIKKAFSQSSPTEAHRSLLETKSNAFDGAVDDIDIQDPTFLQSAVSVLGNLVVGHSEESEVGKAETLQLKKNPVENLDDLFLGLEDTPISPQDSNSRKIYEYGDQKSTYNEDYIKLGSTRSSPRAIDDQISLQKSPEQNTGFTQSRGVLTQPALYQPYDHLGFDHSKQQPDLSYKPQYSSFKTAEQNVMVSQAVMQSDPPRNAHPLIVFGFGGRVIFSFPKKVQRYNAEQDVVVDKVYPGNVVVSKLQNLISVDGNDFPLLNNKSTSAEKIKEHILTLVELKTKCSTSEQPEDQNTQKIDEPHSRKLLWRLLGLLVKHNGKINENPEFSTEFQNILLKGKEDQLDGTDLSSSIVKESAISDFDIKQLQSLIAKGDRNGAFTFAMERKIWSHAFIIASCIGKEAWKEAVSAFTQNQFGDLKFQELRLAYSLFAGAGSSTVREIFAPDIDKSSLFTPALASGESTKEDSTPEKVNRLHKWKDALALILNNRTPNDTQAIRELGDVLSNAGFTAESHICYLLSSKTSADSTESRITLVGASKNRKNSCLDLEAIKMTEVFEYANSLSGVAELSCIPYFQSFKFLKAVYLAENGLLTESLRYCESITKCMKNYGSVSPYFHSSLAFNLQDLMLRIEAYSGAKTYTESSSWFSLRKPTFTSIVSSVENGLTKFITGEESANDSNQAQKNHPPTAIQRNIGQYIAQQGIRPASTDPFFSNHPNFISRGTNNSTPASYINNVSAGGWEPSGLNNVVASVYAPDKPQSGHSPTLQHEEASNNVNKADSTAYGGWWGTSQIKQDETSSESPKKTTTRRYEADDDEDLGFGNNSLSKQHKAPNTNETSEESTPSEKPPPTSQGLFGGLRRLFGGGSGGPVKAKLGETSSFVYDPELKRWVNKNGAMPSEQASSPAPPKSSAPQSRVSSPPLIEQRPPGPPSAPPSLGPPRSLNSSPVPKAASIPPSLNGPPEMKFEMSPRMGTKNRKAARMRYVDIMQQE